LNTELSHDSQDSLSVNARSDYTITMASSSRSTNINARDNIINSANTTTVNSNNTTDNRRTYQHSMPIEVKDSNVHIGAPICFPATISNRFG
jgi:hypothetical protein